jgi:TonB-linked SusC/RagA family outer membrane protein
MRKTLTLLALLLFYYLAAYSQTQKFTGKVLSKDGTPIPDASVRIEGAKTGTTTNAKGEFIITARPGTVILISAIAFTPERVTLTPDRPSYSIALSESSKFMDEVVVSAGGLKSRVKEQGYAATSIKATELTNTAPVDVTSSLSGKVPGLIISDAGGGVNQNYRVVLRGQRSLLGNNQALIVLDNVVVPNEILGNLNPDDIANIEVLNGASAVALYGSEASNGALIVTTKKGTKGVPQIRLANTSTFQEVSSYPKLQTEFGGGGNGYGINPDGTPVFSPIENQSYGPKFDGHMVNLGYPLENGDQLMVPYKANNDRKNFWNKGYTNQSDFSVSSGNDNSTLYLSGQYAQVTGEMPGDKYNRATLRLNGTRKVSNVVSTSYNLGWTQNRYDVTTQGADIYNNLLNIPANVPILMFKNWRTNEYANPNGFENPWYQNPYFEADNNREHVRNDYLIGNVQVDVNAAPGLNLTARVGMTTANVSALVYTGKFTYTAYAIKESGGSKSNIPGTVNPYSDYQTRLESDVYATYKKEISKFSFNLTGGWSIRQNNSAINSATVTGLVVPGLYNLSNSINQPTAYNDTYESRLAGLYGDFKVGFNNYLFLEATGRNDWVSILNPPHNSFFYPSVSLSFVASDAITALKEMRNLDYLKFRGSWSKVGQVNLTSDPNSITFGAYSLEPTYSQVNGYPFNGNAGYTVGNQIVKSGLLPEFTKGYEGGIDLSLFQSRVSGSITYYSTHTTNQTVPANVSLASGYSSYLLNSGEVSNQGIETKLSVIAYQNKNWTATVGGNYSHYNNKVISINPALPTLSIYTYGSGAGSYAVPGYQFPVIMGTDYQRDPQGHVIVNGTTGLPVVNQTLQVLGNSNVKDQLGLDLTLRWKNLTLYTLFEYRGGNKIFNNGGATYDWSGTSIRTVAYNRQRFIFPNSVIADPAHAGQYVKNTTAVIQNGNGNDGFWTDATENMGVTSNYVTSAAFWKLRQLSISYVVPASVIHSKAIKNITISAQGRNLFMWVPKSNIYTDPEYSDAGTTSNGIGLTNLQAPPSRYFGGTLSITF